MGRLTFSEILREQEHLMEYPKRAGNSLAAWKAFIINVMRFKHQRHGPNTSWQTPLGEEISPKTGMKALDVLKAEGIIDYQVSHERITGLQRRGAFGRSQGWGGSKDYTNVLITTGPNFPA